MANETTVAGRTIPLRGIGARAYAVHVARHAARDVGDIVECAWLGETVPFHPQANRQQRRAAERARRRA
ncbi:hypothetical protein SAMN02799622_01840 [Methylobacterium sp. UNC378MF]|uniref:Uncharacterized protein n=1 Tax=Methylobacterium oryzae TaxID=334852 RepID=A0ABU7TLM1_9HYPH|nr:hypothetical protein SAMN02799622_01840 [Methylobacterium sp. UNC378MF]